MTYKKFFHVCFIFVLSACAAVPQAVPTETAIPDTPTPAATSTPTDTPTPEATSTPTQTPLPTATFTPNVTATQLPEITPAAEGKSNVAGLVLWNDQPVPKAAVWLCEGFEGGCVGRYQYRTNTDRNGYYVFENVTPGKYVVAINSFSTAWFIFYFDSEENREQEVVAGKDLILDPWNIWKMDLTITYPSYRKAIAEEFPTFKWNAYPDAAYYKITLYYDADETFNGWDLHQLLDGERVDKNEYTPSEALTTCEYYWYVDAYNAQGTLIAQTKPPTAYMNEMYFINVDLPTKC